MIFHRLELRILGDRFAICRLGHDAEIPAWAMAGQIFSITRTTEELSVVCREASVPAGVLASRGWRGFWLVGTFDFSVVGILASLTTPLAEAAIGVFAISTFDTDYLLVKQEDLTHAAEVLESFGHVIRGVN